MTETTRTLPKPQKPGKQKPDKPRLAALLLVFALVLLLGAVLFVSRHATPPDPTLTRAPPPGPHAHTLYPSAAKLANGGHLVWGARDRQRFPGMRRPGAPKRPR